MKIIHSSFSPCATFNLKATSENSTAPSFPKNSKNLLLQDRNVREAYRDQTPTPVHVLSKGFATDLNAKPSEPTDFLAKRAVLLNIKANPDFAKYL